MSNTTHRGDVAELMAAAELVRRGYIVSRPLTNGAAYDLLVDLGSQIVKVQVKRAYRLPNGTLRVALSTSKYHRGRARALYVDRVECVMAVECGSNRYFVFSGNDLNTAEIALRDSPAKNNQRSGVRMSADHGIDRLFPSRNVVGDSGIEPLTSTV